MIEQELAPVAEKAGIWRRIWKRLADSEPATRMVAFYRRHERYTPALFFFGGVAWDASTLKRIDAWFDNLFLLVYLVAAGLLIIATQLVEQGRARSERIVRFREWYPAGIQFFLGALFSAYVIYYSQSASLTHSSIFLVLLVGLLVGNEFVHRKLVNLYLVFALYFLAAFSFFIFFVPVVTRTMSYWTFLLGGVLALGVVYGLLRYLNRRQVFKRRFEYAMAVGLIIAMFVLLNGFWLLNWIPPVPLALRHGGVYHAVQRQGSVFDLEYEPPAWYRFWEKTDRVFRYAEGDRVYCFAAVFAPGGLHTRVYHRWSRYDEQTRTWSESDRIGYDVVGERDRGFRGYTYKRNVSPGKWRVDVLTGGDKILGRIRFDVEHAPAEGRKLVRAQYD